MKLSDNFWFSEFSNRDPSVLTSIQLYMIKNLAERILQPIRNYLTDVFAKDVSIKIVSGVRFPSDLNRLRAQGYNPSETSDHLCGNIVKLRSAVKIRQYGKYFQYSVGAADVIPSCGAKEAWDVLKVHFVRENGIIALPTGNIQIGQVILEKRNSYWLHISNPKTIVYSKAMADLYLKTEPFLISLDNGKSYKPYS